jgi:hypothetical protein
MGIYDSPLVYMRAIQYEGRIAGSGIAAYLSVSQPSTHSLKWPRSGENCIVPFQLHLYVLLYSNYGAGHVRGEQISSKSKLARDLHFELLQEIAVALQYFQAWPCQVSPNAWAHCPPAWSPCILQKLRRAREAVANAPPRKYSSPASAIPLCG